MKFLARPVVLASSALVSLILIAAPSPSLAQQRTPGSFGAFGSQTTSLTSVAANEAVQKDLGLSADVAAKLRELREDYNAARLKEFRTANVDFQNFRELSEAEREKATAKIAELTNALDDEFTPQVKALITEGQFKRIEQIRVQANLRNLGPLALIATKLATELKLTDEQKQKLNELNTAYIRQRGELRDGGNPGGSPEAFSKLRDETNAKVIGLLSAEQQAALDKLKGSDFDVTQLGFGGRGRRGNN